jgi:hypothetical protein
MAGMARNAKRPVTSVLAFLFLLSAVMNLGYKISLGLGTWSFLSPSTTIAEFEITIAIVLIAAIVITNLYVYGGAYLFAVVGIAEGLLSSDVQGLARYIHELMLPFVLCGWILLVIDAQRSYKARGHQTTSERRREIVAIMQFFVGGLVTLGGASFMSSGTYPVGTILGSIHLVVGLTGLYAGYAFYTKKTWSKKFLIVTNGVTIAYSTFAESLAEIYAYLPRGINDALIGTIIAIVVSGAIIYLLASQSRSHRFQHDDQVTKSSHAGKQSLLSETGPLGLKVNF